MSSVINTNVASLSVQRQLSRSQTDLSTAVARLASGLRINGAKDDAAGLAIADRFTSQIRGLSQAGRNANDGISLAQTAEGGLSSTTTLLQRMRELAVQSANATNSTSDRAAIQLEVSQLVQEVGRVAATTQFNGRNLLDGSLVNAQFQVGANALQTVAVNVATARPADLGNQRLAGVSGFGSVNAPSGITPSFTANRTQAQNLTIATARGSSGIAVAAGESAAAVAARINAQSGATGVTASARNVAYLADFSVDGIYTFQLAGKNSTANAVNIAGAVTTTDSSGLADAINAQTAITGIRAVANVAFAGYYGSAIGIRLENDDGSDIKIADVENQTSPSPASCCTAYGAGGDAPQVYLGGDPSYDSVTMGGILSLDGPIAYSLTSDAWPGGDLFFAPGTNASTLVPLAAIDISTVAGANAALSTIDAALGAISYSRSSLGALQNRLLSTVDSLRASSENVSAARSRVEDADYASETAALTRGQILQDAGSAVLVQANASASNVLALLKG